MKYIFTIIVFLFAFLNGFGQSQEQTDSINRARIEQYERRIEKRRHHDLESGATSRPTHTPQPTTEDNQAQGITVPSLETKKEGIQYPTPLSDEVRLEVIRQKLDILEAIDKNYSKEVEELSISRLPLSELLRNIAKVYEVNINVKGVENVYITSNFSRAKITDLIFFLCKEYNLDIDVVGNIVSVSPKRIYEPGPKIINVSAGTIPGTISFDLKYDLLPDVVKHITNVGQANFIIQNKLNNKTLSGYGKDMQIADAIIAIASANGLLARKSKDDIWEIVDAEESRGSSYRYRSAFNEDQLYVDSLGLITAQIAYANVQEVITDLCERKGANYFFITPITHTVLLNVKKVGFETLLGIIFSGTEYGYYLEDGIYLFGTFNIETLNSVRVIPLTNRSVSKVEDVIPSQLKDGLELKTFFDLNSIIVSGDQRKMQRVENFLKSIDKRVPLVTIEVIIVDVTKTDLFEAGVGLGIGDAPVKTLGTLSPGIDMTLSSSAVNSILRKGFGSINLGRVTPQFYANLKFMEENGTIQLHSTPRLSTLNGNPAKLSSGEKSYYKEVQTNYWGSQTPTPSESYVWKEVEANLEIDIIPYVSEDNLITLEITIIQSEFTERVEDDGPYGITSRSFKSIIRVKNEEMVLLGGIDRNSHTRGARGLPGIAKIPIIRWFFGKEKKNKIEQKLNVFIKPTVID